jgi:AraC-like DNA-binding protein
LKALLTNLKQLMADEKLYLDPDLSLPKLAEHLGTSVNHLSQAINSGLEMTFFDYINQYRVNEAMDILRNGNQRFPAILDVALSVGFNSTSTFYTAFKKINGHSPAKFRRAQSQSQ